MGLIDKLVGRRQTQKEKAAEKYQRLVSDAAAGKMGDDDKTLTALDDCLERAGKTPDEFQADVSKLQEVTRLTTLVEKLPGLEKAFRDAAAVEGELAGSREKKIRQLDADIRAAAALKAKSHADFVLCKQALTELGKLDPTHPLAVEVKSQHTIDTLKGRLGLAKRTLLDAERLLKDGESSLKAVKQTRMVNDIKEVERRVSVFRQRQEVKLADVRDLENELRKLGVSGKVLAVA